MIDYKLVIVKPWSTSFNFRDEVLKVIPLWVRFPNLPLNYWGPKSLSRIASVLGNPICVDECTTKLEHMSCARVLVEINVIGPLPKVVRVMDPNDTMFKQKVSYDRKPQYYPNCCQIGHLYKSQPPQPKVQQAGPKAGQKKVKQAWNAKDNKEHAHQQPPSKLTSNAYRGPYPYTT
ncbi:hypothetical protein R3W88_014564 [Solanum pinnatisectum]|uniref:DUF4283 domain-containing protein n=1 Tax=Solanum pinnatisectum TaxID=50273 RepID=A0AAV9KSF1_9SOLN|nr:hypothetical protein R3W88_014564 [Solanum pinnatisectum]